MPPLYRKMKAVQLRQECRRDLGAFLLRYRRAVAGIAGQSTKTDPSVEEMIDAILAREEAEQSTMMRAIAA